MSTMNYSEHQNRIFDFCATGTGSAIVVAVAGSGKTTTLVESFKRIETKALMLAFNKSIAEELKGRVPANVQVGTFHSVGFVAWQKFVGGRVQVDSGKVRAIMKEMLGSRDIATYGAFIVKAISLAKAAGMGHIMPDVESEWVKLCDHYNHAPDVVGANIPYAIGKAREILARSNAESKAVVDFDDMLFMPLIENVSFPQFPFVCIDEAQDTNGVQRALLKRMVETPNGRLIAVGDPCQAIYGFRGADSSAMTRIKEEFGCVELPLTVSYRCAKQIIMLAKQLVPYIESHESAPDGQVSRNPVTYCEETQKHVAWPLSPNDAILCRNSAPLVSLAYTFIGSQIPCQILGRDIGKGLVDLVKKMSAYTIDALQGKLAEYMQREVSKLMSKGEETQAEAIQDKVTCINICIASLQESNRSIEGLISSIESLFADVGAKGVLTLCTVHKSKGLEWDRVYILDKEKYMPSKWAKKAWQQDQEKNLMYVAYTRAKKELCFIDSDHVEKHFGGNAQPKMEKPATEAKKAYREGDKIEAQLTLTRNTGFETKYGWMKVMTFEDASKQQFVWKTTSAAEPPKIGEKRFVSATVKKLSEYQGKQQIEITRASLS